MRSVFYLICIALLTGSCISSTKSKISQTQWKVQMNELAQTLGELLPFAANSRLFHDPKQEELILEKTQKIYSTAKSMNKDKIFPDQDPSLKFSSERFSKEMESLYLAFNSGNKKLAQFKIKNTTNYCISCHSRTNQGTRDYSLNWKVDLSHFNSMEKTQFFLATRQYKKALLYAKKSIQSQKEFNKDPQGWQLGLEKTLALLVRVDQSPQKSLKFINLILRSPVTPQYYQDVAKKWKTATLKWMKKPPSKSLSREQRLQLAKSLINNVSQRTPRNRWEWGLIEYLRASALLHEVLSHYSSDLVFGEALYLAGKSAEKLKDINLWTLDEAYYEACIHHQPATTLALNCYIKLEAILLPKAFDPVEGHISPKTSKKLRKLKALATDREALKPRKEEEIWRILEHYDSLNF